jgi:hypothetical protein
MSAPSLQLVIWLLIAFAVNGWLAWHTFKRLCTQILLGGVAIFFCMQCLWMLIYLALTGSSLVYIGPEVILNLNDSPFAVAMGQTVMPAVAWTVALIFHSKRTPTTDYLFRTVRTHKSRTFELILCAFALGMLLYFLGTVFVNIPFVTPAIIYIHLSFFMAPLLIGLCWREYRIPLVIFSVAMLVGGIFALSAGSRSLLFLPIVFFAIGFGLTLSRKGKLILFAATMAMTVPVFYVSATIENIRKEGVSDAEREIVGRVREMQRLARDSGASSMVDTISRGVGRMLMWSNWVVLDFSPERVPYRGFTDFVDELIFLNKSTLFRDAQGYLAESLDREFGLGSAKLYGFSVSVGGSVPFPLLADGWARAGLFGAVFFSAIICVLWAIIERWLRRAFVRSPHFALAFITILLSSSYDKMSVYGLIYNLRYLTMQLILWGGLFYIATQVLMTTKASILENSWRQREMPGQSGRLARK